MKFKVYKVTPDKKRTLEFQLEVGEVRPGTSQVDAAVDFVLNNVPHHDSGIGSSPIMDSDGVHLTKWAIVDDTDIYWFVPGGRFRKSPEPVRVPVQFLCRLGRCLTRNFTYQSGDDTVRDLIKAGICPICGGQAEKNE